MQIPTLSRNGDIAWKKKYFIINIFIFIKICILFCPNVISFNSIKHKI